MIPNLANLVGQALDEGAHYIAYRDAEETDLIREIARFASRRYLRDRLMVVAATSEVTRELRGYLRTFQTPSARISQAEAPVQVDTLDHALRRIRYPGHRYTILVLMPDLERDGRSALLAGLPGVAVLDADPLAGPPMRPADHVIYRPVGSALQTLQAATPTESRYRH